MIEEFRIEVPDSELEDLRRRLGQTRLGPPPAAEPWESGVDYEYLAELIGYWRDEFDWRAQEAALNRLDQYTTEIDGRKVHFVHAKPDPESYPRSIPIVLSHGWPYSFLEFLPIIPWLTHPRAHGGSVDDAFEVVVPSLPGYGFSDPMAAPFTDDAVARLWHRLMTESLNHRRYATYGEDVGTTISDWLGALFPVSIIGLFATHPAYPPEERSQAFTAAEDRFRQWLADKWKTGTGYSRIQSTRPDTLAVGLNDSPAGLLAWIVEKLHEWSGPAFEDSWSVDDILTTVSLYWFTQTVGTSFLPYYHGREHEKPIPMVTVPVGVAVHWGERGFPREYAERTYTDIRTWSELPQGGHFTAKQTPDLVARAMREFFAGLRG